MAGMARMVSANVAASLEFGDERQAEKLLQSLRADKDSVSAVVALPEGQFFAGYGPGCGNYPAQRSLADPVDEYAATGLPLANGFLCVCGTGRAA